MIDNTDTIAVAAPVAEPTSTPKRKHSRGPLNKAHLRKLTKAEGVGQAAQNTDYAAPLAAREIDADFVTQFLSDTDDARTKAADALQHSTATQNATATEGKAAYTLVAGLQEVQKAAKQKYARTNRIALGDYFVGKKLNGNRPNLLQTSQTIVNKLADDTLPGITAAKVKKLGTLRQGWIAAKTAQTDSSTAAQSARAELKTMLKSIEDRKVAIQLAADAEWPHTDEANAAIRKEFGLSPRKPL
jgi:hypothetical protein